MSKTSPQDIHITDIIDDIQRLTALHGELGLEYEHKNELNFLLHEKPRQTPLPKTIQKTNRLPKPPSPPQKSKQPKITISETEIENSKQLIAECNSCPHRKPPKFGFGTTDHPFIFVVCDGNSSDPSRPMEEAEESLLGKMLQAIKIKPNQIFVTNLIKCQTENNKPGDHKDMASNCLSHTKQQIRIMQPAMICTMGQRSSQALLNSTNQLMALRGHFHEVMNIPLMATYHPAQLIALAELKKATWYDLQLMQRKLALMNS